MNDQQLLRYGRHILLEEIGIEGQQRLLDARALIVGLGGLGSPPAQKSETTTGLPEGEQLNRKLDEPLWQPILYLCAPGYRFRANENLSMIMRHLLRSLDAKY